MSATALRRAHEDAAHHGLYIYIYNHVRTNQVIYSLTPNITDPVQQQRLLKQLPYLGKKLKPPTIRRDLWAPLATVSFPHSQQGLEAYRKLREFRQRHELDWPDSLRHNTDTDKPVSKLTLGHLLQDQKGNSVADLAAVLLKQAQVAVVHKERAVGQRERAETAAARARTRLPEVIAEMKLEEAATAVPGVTPRYKELKLEKRRLKKLLELPEERLAQVSVPEMTWPRANRQMRLRPPDVSMEGVHVRWTSLQDAELAQLWPGAVTHSVMGEEVAREDVQAAPAEKDNMAVPGRLGDPATDDSTRSIDAQAEPDTPNSTLGRLIDRLQNGRR